MRSSDLNQRVRLYSPTVTENASGEPVTTWSQVAELSAAIISQKGDESFAAARVETGSIIKVKLWYRADVETNWRLDWPCHLTGVDPKPYDIVDIDRSKQADRELWLMCRARKVE